MTGIDLRPSSPAQLALIAIILLGVGWVGLLGPLSSIGLYLGLVMLLVAGVSWMLRPPSPTAYWRGQKIDMSERLTWWGRLYHRLYKR